MKNIRKISSKPFLPSQTYVLPSLYKHLFSQTLEVKIFFPTKQIHIFFFQDQPLTHVHALFKLIIKSQSKIHNLKYEKIKFKVHKTKVKIKIN